MKRLVAALALAGIAGGAVPARAQKAAAPAQKAAAPEQKAAPAESPKLDEAQRRFQRGIELYREADFNAALVEFKRAYEMVPTYKILYNLGQVSYQRHDYASALRYFRQYLDEGGSSIATDRRLEVESDVVRLEGRVGKLEVQTIETGAEILIDDVAVGLSPLKAPILVNNGRRKVEVIARSGEHRTRLVDVAGDESVRVSFPRLVLQPAEPPPSPPRPAVQPQPQPQPRPEPQPQPQSSAPAVVSAVSTPRRERTFPWKSWTLTGLLAGGAAVTGVMAWTSKSELDDQRSRFPSDANEIDYYTRRTNGFALATDGLLIGTAIMTAIALYLTARDPR